jgi:L-asparaginase / beta-aspartyl-peptidase
MNTPIRPAVVSHGGAGGPREHGDACELACDAALGALGEGQSAMEGAIRATMVLEDDPRLNAGTGSNLRLDGRTIEMDAAVMDHRLRFGAVASIQRVRNPVRVAEFVLATPHLLLCGAGATAFARLNGVPDYDPISDRARERYAQVKAFFETGAERHRFPAWNAADLERFWSLPGRVQEVLKEMAGPPDTVGAVVRDAEGHCAAALSTGGTSIMLPGRVGDTPIIGCGLYAGPHGAVAATGEGEEIMRRVLAKQVYDWIAGGMGAQEAVEKGVALVPGEFTVGLIAVSLRDEGVADNRTMPSSIKTLDRV